MLISRQLLWQYKISSSFRQRNQKRWQPFLQIINNSRFVGIKYNFFFSEINSYYQTAGLNVFFQSLFCLRTFLTKFPMETLAVTLYFSVFFRRSRQQTKQTLTLTLLFQRNVLLVVGADNMTIFFIFIGFFRNGAG